MQTSVDVQWFSCAATQTMLGVFCYASSGNISFFLQLYRKQLPFLSLQYANENREQINIMWWARVDELNAPIQASNAEETQAVQNVEAFGKSIAFSPKPPSELVGRIISRWSSLD